MLFSLHADYVQAATPRPGAKSRHRAELRLAQPPPRSGRARVSCVLASVATRVDRESARRVLA
jgi:hypothetical protein